MNTKPDDFPSLGMFGEHCNDLDAHPAPSPHQGSSGFWGDTLAPGISHSHCSNLQMESGFSKSKYCQKFTSCHCMPEPKAAADDTFPPVLEKYACLCIHTAAREPSVSSGRREGRDCLREHRIQQVHLMTKHTWLFAYKTRCHINLLGANCLL